MMSGLSRLVWCLPVLAALPCLVQASIWQDVPPPGLAAKGIVSEPIYYRSLRADQDQLKQALVLAPQEDTSSRGATIELPLPQGGNQAFELEASPVMAPALAAEYPEITTYRVRGIDDPSITGRLDMTPQGFHAMLTTPAGVVFIDPDKSGGYRSFYKQDYATAMGDEIQQPVCHTSEHSSLGEAETSTLPTLAQRTVSGNQRRIYQLAVATTGEYGRYFDGSQSKITSNIVTTINRVNQIYGRDLAVQLRLSALVIYTDPDSDPYLTPDDPYSLLPKNQEILDHELGADSYDIGHLFGLSGEGLARLGSVCSSSKAQGYTGLTKPVGDAFYIDFVAHEMGHQLSATHSFNGTMENCGGKNRNPGTAVEPGSGSTIMAYAGICGGENLQGFSDATFHTVNIQQIHSFAFSDGGSQCGAVTGTGNTAPESIAGEVSAAIPPGTPFVLTGSANDVDGDTLSYQWDEIDSGGDTSITDASTIGSDLGSNPLFRSFVPKSTPTRYFPRLSSLISGVSDIGETLPTTTRTLNFRMTVRDGNSGVADDDLAVSVDAGQVPFRITGGTLNSEGAYTGGLDQSLTWDTAGTDTTCPNVSISLLSLSSDGSTYCDRDDYSDLYLGDFPNTGVAPKVTLRSALIARARVMVACADNVFFDLSDNDIAVSATTPIPSDCKSIDGTSLEHGVVFVNPNITDTFFNGSSDGGGDGGGGGGGSLLWLPLLLGLGGLLRLFVRRETAGE